MHSPPYTKPNIERNAIKILDSPLNNGDISCSMPGPSAEHGQEHTLLQQATSTFFRLLDCLVVVFVPSAAITLHILLQLKLPTPTAIGLPTIHLAIVVLVLTAYTPRQYITTMFLALELAVVMLGATIYDHATLGE